MSTLVVIIAFVSLLWMIYTKSVACLYCEYNREITLADEALPSNPSYMRCPNSKCFTATIISNAETSGNLFKDILLQSTKQIMRGCIAIEQRKNNIIDESMCEAGEFEIIDNGIPSIMNILSCCDDKDGCNSASLNSKTKTKPKSVATFNEDCSTSSCQPNAGLFCNDDQICTCENSKHSWCPTVSSCCDRSKCSTKGITKKGRATALLSDGTRISLRTLDSPSNPRTVTSDICTYYFNPVSPIKCGPFNSSLVCQTCSRGINTSHFELGTLQSASFCKDSNNDIFLTYSSSNSDGDKYERKTFVKCVCGTTESFDIKSESPVLTYNLEFTSPCCCPNGC